jgi:hypothetical protein
MKDRPLRITNYELQNKTLGGADVAFFAMSAAAKGNYKLQITNYQGQAEHTTRSVIRNS